MAFTVVASAMVSIGSTAAAIPAVRQADRPVMLMAVGPGAALCSAGLMIIVAVTNIVAETGNTVVLMVSCDITVFHIAKGIAGGRRSRTVAVAMGKCG